MSLVGKTCFTVRLCFAFLWSCKWGMPAEIDAKIAALVVERKEAKRKALDLQREIKKQKKNYRSLVRSVRGLTSAQLSAAAERAKALEDAATSGGPSSG